MSRYARREIEKDSAPELYKCFAVQVGWVGGGVKTKACYIPADPLPPSATKCQTKDGGRGSGGGQSGLNNGLFSASGGASPTGGDGGGAKAQPAQARAGLATG